MLEFSKDNIIFDHFHAEKQNLGVIMKVFISLSLFTLLLFAMFSCSVLIKDKEELKKISSDLIEEAADDAVTMEI